MQILIDADACPVVAIAEQAAMKYNIPSVILCDTNHLLRSEYSTVRVIGDGADAVDIALINLCRRGDIVITQDYGVAAMALGKGAKALHQSGKEYTDENIDGLLMRRHLGKKALRANKHLKGPAKRTAADDACFAASLERVIREMGYIRAATAADIDAVEAIYAAIHDKEEREGLVCGWKRDIYPTREVAEEALASGTLYVLEQNGGIIAAARFDGHQEEAYRKAAWLCEAADDRVMVMHTLAVHPSAQGKGAGKRFVQFYERYAAQHGCTALRMDTGSTNLPARRLYAALGFREAGIIPTTFNGLDKVELVCLEKQL